MSMQLGIYGAGHLGRLIASETDPSTVFIDDTSVLIGQQIDQKPVISLETFASRYSDIPHLVYLCICLPQYCVYELIQRASSRVKGKLKIVPFTDYFINHPDTKAMPHLLWDRSVFSDEYRRQLHKIRSTFSDNESLTALEYFFEVQIKGLTRPSYISPRDEFHFLESTINSRTHYIDGGAFDGDTIEKFLSLAKESFRKITAVEPDAENVKKLETVISALPAAIRQKIQILPAAIASFSGRAQFQANGNTASCLSSTGQTCVNTVGLKDLIDEENLLIKLDIEGSEESSIKSALPAIRKYLPVLAISVYHHSQDMIRIFEILHNQIPGYQFAFRILGKNATDAMLYCFPRIHS